MLKRLLLAVLLLLTATTVVLLTAANMGEEAAALVPSTGPVRVGLLFGTISGVLAYCLFYFPEVAKRIEEALLSALLAATSLIVFVEVVMRYGFNFGFHWMEELTLLMSGWMVLLGMSYGIKVGSHIGVDALVRLMSSDTRRRVTMIAVALCLLYCALFIMGAWEYILKLNKIGIELNDLPVPKWVAFSGVMVGFIMLTLRFLELGWALLQRTVDGFSLADEAKDALKLRQAAEAEGRIGQ